MRLLKLLDSNSEYESWALVSFYFIHFHLSTYNLPFFTYFHNGFFHLMRSSHDPHFSYSSFIILYYFQTLNQALNLSTKSHFYFTALVSLFVSHCYQPSYLLLSQLADPLSGLRISRPLANKNGISVTDFNMSLFLLHAPFQRAESQAQWYSWRLLPNVSGTLRGQYPDMLTLGAVNTQVQRYSKGRKQNRSDTPKGRYPTTVTL